MKRLAVAASMVLFSGIVSGIAHADEPNTTDTVCNQLRLGVPPGVIAQQLHQGDPRYSIFNTTQTVLDDSHECP